MADLGKIGILFSCFMQIFSMVHSIRFFMHDFESDFRLQFDSVLVGDKDTFQELPSYTYEVPPEVTKIIVYIVNRNRYIDISRREMQGKREEIADVVGKSNYRLLMLGISQSSFENKYDFLSEWMTKYIISERNSGKFAVETIGEDIFDREYKFNGQTFAKYKEEKQIFNFGLQKVLRSFPESEYKKHAKAIYEMTNDKEIRIYDPSGKTREYRQIMRLPITLENHVYVPQVDLKTTEFNYMKRHEGHEIHFVIFDGRTFSELVIEHIYKPHRSALRNSIEQLRVINATIVLFVGCFNIDWSEADIVAQVIVRHSGLLDPYKKIFTFGLGMFHTAFRDTNVITPSSNHEIFAIVKELTGVKMMQPLTMEIFDLNRVNMSSGNPTLEYTEIPIVPVNGYYDGSLNNGNYSYAAAYPGTFFAFIVIDSTTDAIQHANHHSSFQECVKRLAAKNIMVFVINVNNFKWYDVHIVAEVIGLHGGIIEPVNGLITDPVHILVVGSTIFNTVYDFGGKRFRTLSTLNGRQSLEDMRTIIMALTLDTLAKAASFYSLTNNDSVIKRFRVATINGIYQPEPLIQPFIGTTEGKNVFLIITEQHLFDLITTNGRNMIEFRKYLQHNYSFAEWDIYLVGLLNFIPDGRENYLFGEIIRADTKDPRPFSDFVETFTHSNVTTVWQYRNTMPMKRIANRAVHQSLYYLLQNCMMFN